MPRPPIDRDLFEAIRAGAERGLSPARIVDDLASTPAFAGRNPSIRTVQRIVHDLRPTTATVPWTLAGDETGEPRLILDVLAAVITETEGRRRHISTEEARWVALVEKAAQLPHFDLYLVAREYLRRDEARKDTTDLDHWLAFGPDQYEEAVRKGWAQDAR